MSDQREKIEENIRQLEAAKASGALPASVADASIAALREKLATYSAENEGNGAIAQGQDAFAVGQNGIGVEGSVGGDIVTGVKIVLGLEKKSLPHPEALARYLENMVATHQLLRLQGIRAGDQPLSVLLEKVYVSLTAVAKQAGTAAQGKKTANEADALHGGESGILSIGSALARYPRLVIIGDPGSGKTTLLAYLALTYARTLADSVDLIKKRLGLNEANRLPILLPLRDLGYHLSEKHPNPGKDGPALLLDYLHEYYAAQAIDLPLDFFSVYLEKGQAVVLLDGMDEVADAGLRQRVARLIEKFAARFGQARFVVTSREVGYDGPARIGAQFGLAKVRDFTPQEVRRFVHDWTRVVETSLAGGESPDVLRMANEQAAKLIRAIEGNPRVAELAINPLLLTVIALVHRYRAELPERRSELYEEAVEVLLWHWDRAKGLDDEQNLGSVKLDSGDRRSFLEPVAFWMHERNRREIELADLRALLFPRLKNMTGDDQRASRATDNFLRVISERSGLLIERGMGIYGFAHLTFQEYLAARTLAGREDMLEYTLKVLPNPWWREVILLQAGYVSGQGPSRVSKLIQSIMDADPKTEPEPHHHLLLAAECLFDVGNARVEGDLLGQVRLRLQKQADAPLKKGDKPALLAKLAAMNALARIESGKITSQFWKAPWGEPDWITIPAGEFWMGGDGKYDGKPLHKLHLPEYQIARVPVTNAQYAIYVNDSGAKAPEHWRGGQVPAGLENHPVVNVSWHEALAYCKWLGEKINKPVSLPSEAEWEKAAKGPIENPQSKIENRNYPWGESWKELHCNSDELGLNETTPVGLFLNGASPYELLDMSGNVWEWTRSFGYDVSKYPYDPKDGREDLSRKDVSRALRGGSFFINGVSLRCAFRSQDNPDYRLRYLGFRVMLSPLLLSQPSDA
ncbi:MAG: SUMF1/EgtB/PvdO family nonheme iron enzyme [Anaerolineales bacterium]|nr:SUMF1/EgtB/PvdO family nonheme iron enzyme [Anaerolineales bacterium]